MGKLIGSHNHGPGPVGCPANGAAAHQARCLVDAGSRKCTLHPPEHTLTMQCEPEVPCVILQGRCCSCCPRIGTLPSKEDVSGRTGKLCIAKSREAQGAAGGFKTLDSLGAKAAVGRQAVQQDQAGIGKTVAASALDSVEAMVPIGCWGMGGQGSGKCCGSSRVQRRAIEVARGCGQRTRRSHWQGAVRRRGCYINLSLARRRHALQQAMPHAGSRRGAHPAAPAVRSWLGASLEAAEHDVVRPALQLGHNLLVLLPR